MRHSTIRIYTVISAIIFLQFVYTYKLNYQLYGASRKEAIETNETRVVSGRSWAEKVIDDPVSLFTLVLSLFTGGLYLATRSLWTSTEKLVTGAEKTAERQLRGYLTIIGQRSSEDLNYITIRVKNCGSTPLFNLRGHLDRHGRPDMTSLPEDFPYQSYNRGDRPSNVIIAPSQVHHIRFQIDSEQMIASAEGKKRYFVYGDFRCTDIYEKGQTIEFCFENVLVDGRRVFVAHHAHNGAAYGEKKYGM